ncbi:MAG: type II toxin-antitoxin system HicB family antitoxin [Chloroflexi bacterium]|nr:type II toxin-antitoxin system HicB family antitoxin [Chloroflexota bacterium]
MKEILLDIHLEALPEGGFLATSHDLPGLVAQGRTAAEAIEIAQDVARKLIESYIEHGDELPPALRAAIPASGDVRIPVTVS